MAQTLCRLPLAATSASSRDNTEAQAVPPEVAQRLPGSWPFARPAPTVATNAVGGRGGSTSDSANDNVFDDDDDLYPAAFNGDHDSAAGAAAVPNTRDDTYSVASDGGVSDYPAASNTTPATAITSATSTTTGECFDPNPSGKEAKVPDESDGGVRESKAGISRPVMMIIPSFSSFDSGSRHSSSSGGSDSTGDGVGAVVVVGGKVVRDTVEEGSRRETSSNTSGSVTGTS